MDDTRRQRVHDPHGGAGRLRHVRLCRNLRNTARCFDDYVDRLGVSWSELLALGRLNPADPEEPFNMAWLAMRGCSWVNGVSRLHGAVSRQLFAGLFPRWPRTEVPVGSCHQRCPRAVVGFAVDDALWTQTVGKERWRGDVSALTADMLRLPDEELWRLRARERRDLVRVRARRSARKLARHGTPTPRVGTAGKCSTRTC